MPKEKMFGYEVREPYESESEYFKNNQHVAGMATEDDRIIVNPHIQLTPEQRNGLLMNEASRIYMRQNNIVPDIDITPEQEKYFSNTNYSSNHDAMRQTIIGRILSNDTSIGTPTKSQMEQAKIIYQELRKRMYD